MALEETTDIDNWFLQTIRDDAILQQLFGTPGLASGVRVYNEVAPQQTIYPLIIFNMVDAPDINGVGGVRIGMWPRYQVKVICKDTGYSTLVPFWIRLDTLIQQQGAVIGISGQNWIGRWIRSNFIKYPEIFDNVNWFHMGGQFKALFSRP